MIIGREDCGQGNFELIISKHRKVVDGHAPAQLPTDSVYRSQFSRDRRSFGTRRSRMLWREINARHFDDGLPRGFLAGAIVEVWVALHLNWT